MPRESLPQTYTMRVPTRRQALQWATGTGLVAATGCGAWPAIAAQGVNTRGPQILDDPFALLSETLIVLSSRHAPAKFEALAPQTTLHQRDQEVILSAAISLTWPPGVRRHRIIGQGQDSFAAVDDIVAQMHDVFSCVIQTPDRTVHHGCHLSDLPVAG